MNVQETLIDGQATQRAMLTALADQLVTMQRHSDDRFTLMATEMIRAEARSAERFAQMAHEQAATEAKAEASAKILSTFKTQGGTVLTIVGLLGATFGGLVTAKASGVVAAVMGWLSK